MAERVGQTGIGVLFGGDGLANAAGIRGDAHDQSELLIEEIWIKYKIPRNIGKAWVNAEPQKPGKLSIYAREISRTLHHYSLCFYLSYH